MPHVFKKGDEALADEVNENFSWLNFLINNNKIILSSWQGGIRNNENKINNLRNELKSTIEDNPYVYTHTDMWPIIHMLVADTDTNTSDLSSNSTAIGTNTGAIGTNTGAISTNTGAIGTNTGAISTNTTNISSIDTAIGGNITRIINNDTAINDLNNALTDTVFGTASDVWGEIKANFTNMATNYNNIATLKGRVDNIWHVDGSNKTIVGIVDFDLNALKAVSMANTSVISDVQFGLNADCRKNNVISMYPVAAPLSYDWYEEPVGELVSIGEYYEKHIIVGMIIGDNEGHEYDVIYPQYLDDITSVYLARPTQYQSTCTHLDVDYHGNPLPYPIVFERDMTFNFEYIVHENSQVKYTTKVTQKIGFKLRPDLILIFTIKLELENDPIDILSGEDFRDSSKYPIVKRDVIPDSKVGDLVDEFIDYIIIEASP
jgi:hypothetical protein